MTVVCGGELRGGGGLGSFDVDLAKPDENADIVHPFANLS